MLNPESMETPYKPTSRSRFYVCLFSFVLLTALLTSSCKKPSIPYSILEFSDVSNVMNYSKSPMLVTFKGDSINPVQLLSGKGDLLMIEDEMVLYNHDLSQNKYQYSSHDGLVFNNEKVISVSIPKNDNLIPWFQKMNATDISNLEYIGIDSLPESYLPYLRELAKIKPDIGLVSFNGNLEETRKLLKIFNPSFLMAGEVPQSSFSLFAQCSNIELLQLVISDSINTIPLPAMPKLNQIILGDLSNGVSLSDELFINNPQIEKLIILNPKDLDLSVIKPLTKLKELVINESENITNYSLLKDQKNLELLSISCKSFKYGPELNNLKNIRWITFSSNTTQNEFNSFVENHPDLEVVEIAGNDTISSFESLLSLKKLYGLSVTDTITDFNSLKSLKNLKYLSLPDKNKTDSTRMAELKMVLPDTVIVANEGFCLGSGWLLLIVPFVVLFRSLRSLRKT